MYNLASVFLNKDFATCMHVFLRSDVVRQSLQPLYESSYQDIGRKNKYTKRHVTKQVDSNDSVGLKKHNVRHSSSLVLSSLTTLFRTRFPLFPAGSFSLVQSHPV
ncbi:hypothetical protein NPIL_109051 [Nephila pilipes]|uniref:Uncharacterized protein n=1 Tax=Nephila pilipes TaxID=299642 RepID=A0A8X6MQ58_NEPPI|nr:hypothetical protein NPIL_109051 [Nephila pilipes]